MLLFVTSIKLIAEIALLAFAGQWLLGLLAGQKRAGNIFYQLLQILTRPFVTAARWVMPSRVPGRHLPLIAFLALLLAWLAATLAKIGLCLQTGVNLCR